MGNNMGEKKNDDFTSAQFICLIDRTSPHTRIEYDERREKKARNKLKKYIEE